MLKRLISLVKNKLVTILASTTVILILSLSLVTWQYIESVEKITALEGDKIALEHRVIACGEELRTAIDVRGDVEGTFEETFDELNESKDEFAKLREKIRDLEKRQCTNVSGEQNAEESKDSVAADPVIDEYYRVLFRAHCLSTGTGSCDSTGDVLR